LGAKVWSVEIVEEFVESAQNRSKHVGAENVSIRVGDGSRGWAEHAPYDRILVAAAAKEIPKAQARWAPSVPLGAAEDQRLSVLSKSTDSAVEVRAIMLVRLSEFET
jgi:protein-L-isoaspartate(D-aspartate) O-methyltransferase